LEEDKAKKRTILHQQMPVDENGQPALNKEQINVLHDYIEFVMPDDCILVTTPENVSVRGRGYNVIPIHDKKYSCDELSDIVNLYNGQQALRKGLKIGVAIKGRNLAESFLHEEFNKPDKSRRGKNSIVFNYKNGDTVEWIKPVESNRGKRLDILYIEKSIDEEIISHILLPMVGEGTVKYFDYIGKIAEEAIKRFEEYFGENSAQEILSDLDEKNPVHTILDEFKKNYPGAPMKENGIPRGICPRDLGYKDYWMTCEDEEECVGCWSRPAKNKNK